jgi:hypothetical protein
MSLTNPTTISEFLDVTNVDEEIKPLYTRWIENIEKRTYRSLFFSFFLGVVVVWVCAYWIFIKGIV